MASAYVRIIPDPASNLPAFNARVDEIPLNIWGGGNEPFPTPPIMWPGYPRPEPPQPPESTAPSAKWMYQGDGWYFVAGPFSKPRPIGGLPGQMEADPVRSRWSYLMAGWYFVSGPYPKPLPIPGVPEPEPPEPPTEPAAEGDWEYRGDGWYFTYGPLPKPKPLPPA